MDDSYDFSAREQLEHGLLWKDQAARQALPILLWLAERGQTITYKQLAEELQRRCGMPVQRRYTLYGQPAGKIGYAMQRLSEEWGEPVPPINALVVNARTLLPGDGADYFILRYLNPRSRKMRIDKATKNDVKRELIDEVFKYRRWDQVRRALGVGKLQPVQVLEHEEEISLPEGPAPRGGYPESLAHKALKTWAAGNPRFFHVLGRFKTGSTEKWINSGDFLDAYLEGELASLAVEVKASNAPVSELCRGVFQCVKYRATLRAMQKAKGEYPTANSVLLTTKALPRDIAVLAKRLQVPVLVAPANAEKTD